ncbi:DUF418 domain-containing protein [Streptomyces sp. NPDC057638]|uniref:DUF418 domain-containing protein n=1 Tax=Streptomyces sp. NPDC057638 TaxID=3346190 RepID=UPI0036C93206
MAHVTPPVSGSGTGGTGASGSTGGTSRSGGGADGGGDHGRAAAPPPRSTTPAAPARLAHVDTLRGFALLGILIVNITFLASAYRGAGLAEPGFDGPLDQAVRWIVAVLFEGKFFLLFSFLFGYGLTLQLASAERRGTRFTPRFLRRLAGLFVLGALHAVLLFPGDILTTYAVLGLILLALHRIRPRTAVRIAVTLLAVTGAAYALLAFALRDTTGTSTATLTAHAEAATEALRGGPASVIGAHLDQLPDVAVMLVFFQAPAALAAFLLGLAAGRRRALADPAEHPGALRRLQLWGLTAGLAGGVVYAHSAQPGQGTGYQVLGIGVDVVTAPLLAAAYAATVLLLARRWREHPVTALFTAAGRMTLTNYLTQSLVCALLFTGYGAGLVGQVSPAGLLALALALFTVQAAVCQWWLRHHPYGPAEWLLRAWSGLSRPDWRGRAR